MRRMRPFSSHRVLRPFLESYQVVSDQLAHWEAGTKVDESLFLTQCLATNEQSGLARK